MLEGVPRGVLVQKRQTDRRVVTQCIAEYNPEGACLWLCIYLCFLIPEHLCSYKMIWYIQSHTK